MPLASRLTMSVACAPKIRRDSRSRPSVSVPSRYLAVGPKGAPMSSSPSSSCTSGGKGAIQGAKMAPRTTTVMTIRPSRASLRWKSAFNTAIFSGSAVTKTPQHRLRRDAVNSLKRGGDLPGGGSPAGHLQRTALLAGEEFRRVITERTAVVFAMAVGMGLGPALVPVRLMPGIVGAAVVGIGLARQAIRGDRADHAAHDHRGDRMIRRHLIGDLRQSGRPGELVLAV